MNEWTDKLHSFGDKRQRERNFDSAGFKRLMFPLEALWGGNGPQVRVHFSRGQTDTKRWQGAVIMKGQSTD